MGCQGSSELFVWEPDERMHFVLLEVGRADGVVVGACRLNTELRGMFISVSPP